MAKIKKPKNIGNDMEQLELLILNNQWVKEEISKNILKNIKKLMKVQCQFLYDEAKAMPRRKFIALVLDRVSQRNRTSRIYIYYSSWLMGCGDHEVPQSAICKLQNQKS